MLLSFTTKNYKSFKDEMTFSMTPAPKQKGLDYSILQMKAGSRVYKGLSTAVIYGPNASGKSNVIGAMDTFRSIVLRGSIHNADSVSPNAPASYLELIPNCDGAHETTDFSIRFISNGLMVEYSFKADLGTFMDKDFPRKITEEKLYVNNSHVFTRTEDGLEVDLGAPPKKMPEMNTLVSMTIFIRFSFCALTSPRQPRLLP